jgi:segregation and condensation protein B
VDLSRAKCVLEAALLCAPEPLSVQALVQLFEPQLEEALILELLEDLSLCWHGRGMELVKLATGWRFQSSVAVQPYLERMNPERPPRYSRAVIETLAIIAYKQPVTRAEIEAIRGVAVATSVVKALEEREWIEVVGHRETPGRPALLGTTKRFLSDMALLSLSDLPVIQEAGGVTPELIEAK